MIRYFMRILFNRYLYPRTWIPFYIEVYRHEFNERIIFDQAWCPTHEDDGILYNGAALCCKLYYLVSEEGRKELDERTQLLETCSEGRIVAVYDLQGMVEFLVDSPEVKTWDKNDQYIETVYSDNVGLIKIYAS